MKEQRDMGIICKSPFAKTEGEEGPEWEFVAELPDGGELRACIHPAALLASLSGERGDDELLVCGCSDAGCAGFRSESFEWSDSWIEWRVNWLGKRLVWRFDREVYECGAIRMLRDIHDSRKGWDFCFWWYPSFEDFEREVGGSLAESPRFRKMWEEERTVEHV